jgi:peptide/nickel transport system permease protein
MLHFILRRFAVAVLVALTVLTLAFLLTRLSGDLAISIAGPNATAADVETIRQAYGLNRPLCRAVFRLARPRRAGRFRRELLLPRPCGEPDREPHGGDDHARVGGLAIALVVSLPLGILAAVREGTWVDRAVSLVALIGQAMPSFWLGLVLMITFGLHLGWLPISAWVLGALRDARRGAGLLGHPVAHAPDAVGHDRGAVVGLHPHRACEGASRLSILVKHGFRNAAIPVVSIAAVQLGFMLGGSIVIETVFALHGIGYLAWESISKNDFPVVQAVVLVLALIYIALTLLADLLNAVLDPRLRTS